MSADPFEGRVILTVPNHRHDVPAAHARMVWRGEQPRFAHPEAVKAYWKLVLGNKKSNGFARYLGMRDRDPQRVKVTSLVPPCVALVLREVGGMKGRKSVLRLLNQHVYVGSLEESKISEDGSDKNRENALFEQVDEPELAYKVKQPLYAAAHALLSAAR
jgi:hypothetical protein